MPLKMSYNAEKWGKEDAEENALFLYKSLK